MHVHTYAHAQCLAVFELQSSYLSFVKAMYTTTSMCHYVQIRYILIVLYLVKVAI